LAIRRSLGWHGCTSWRERYLGRTAARLRPAKLLRPAGDKLELLTWKNQIQNAATLAVLVSLSVLAPNRPEAAVTSSVISEQTIQVEHVRIVSTKPFAQVEAALDTSVPELDPAIALALSHGELDRAKKLERGSELFIFLKRDHGALLRAFGQTRKALQYEIANPLAAATMTRYQLPAALYAPLRAIVWREQTPLLTSSTGTRPIPTMTEPSTRRNSGRPAGRAS